MTAFASSFPERIELARAGNRYIQQFTFENSFKLFKDVIANGFN